MESWTAYPLLVGVGLVAGVLNVIAGGGSFLTLPVLIFVGLPPTVANGTNRIGILLQNVVAVWGFHRYRMLEWRSILWAALPATAGAGLGTWGALMVSDEAFRRILAVLMVAISLWTLWSPLEPHRERSRPRFGLLGAGFFVVGIYGGFVQAGVGFLVLAATSLARLDLVRGNAVKVLSILCFSVLSLALFAWQGKVAWLAGLSLGVGSMVGGLLGVRLSVLKGHAWIQRVVTVTILVFAVKLWFD